MHECRGRGAPYFRQGNQASAALAANGCIQPSPSFLEFYQLAQDNAHMVRMIPLTLQSL